jgi:hypothetical protein
MLSAVSVRADADQSDVISAHGDALARSTSAASLVKPMPAAPPNSTPPVIPASAVVPAPAGATPPFARPQPGPAPAPNREPDARRYDLIALGALIALAMFLWERRRKD